MEVNKKKKKTEEIQVDEAIRPYLNEIAVRLWSGHGAVMVGAGFSKNAHSSFPSWEELGDLFYEKAYEQKPGNRKYLNVSRLADEIQASMGRPALNHLLKSNIPDEVSEPSQLHIQLLELPWTDVFTTNYDTLLERACSSVTSRKYDVVVNQEDLIYSEKPRIIKLHGSFPSERPFIITEEDYRRYPMEFAPFVNTVQQALLENMLCLIGFSGDDPNFLHWIGWIRDNLGSTDAPKIYLVGIISLSDAQKKLLEQRNVVLVDFSKSPGVAGDHYKALDRFCKYLLSKKEEDNRLGWAMDQKRIDPDLNNHDKIAQLKDILGVWKSARLSYPGWCVLPEDQRTYLWISTQNRVNFICSQDDIPTPLDIEYAYELNWRLEKCLCPIQDNLADLFERILHKYWPFPNVSTTNTAPFTPETPDFRKLDLDSIRKMRLHLYLSMLRFYREEGLLEKWQDIDKKLDGLYPYLSPEQIAFLHYERTLYALFALDVPEVKTQIKAWPSNESLPFWETKRAGLLAEIGQVEDADRILEQSLRSIRSKLNLKPVTTDYSWVSQEAFTMLLLQYVRSSGFLKNRIRPENKDIQRQFMERWNTLKQYRCDPWNEFKLFENYLEREPVEIPAVSEKKDFDIGRVTQTRRFGGNNKEAIFRVRIPAVMRGSRRPIQNIRHYIMQ
ncbi:MAG: SIR2-like domain protein [Candidatus Brocadiaceae bacterium]|nr:SIR2-like domain protein [Candidatus Brocadiaceae bacterium]